MPSSILLIVRGDRLMLAVIALLVLSAALLAQAPAQGSNPGVKLDLHCASPCSFRQGESIWLDLDFTTSAPFIYSVLTNYTDRDNAREEFIVTPTEGASDPLAPYMWIIQVQAGSFNFKRTSLSDKPVTVRMNLNQWIRFDQPGDYHVSVTSSRVGNGVRVTSNEIVLKVVQADPQWQQEQLAHIRGVLDSNPASPFGEAPKEIRELCDLGTEEAAIEIARHMGDSRNFRLYEFGLIRSPYKAAGIREMERLLVDPDAPVTELFLRGMANASVDPISERSQTVVRSVAKLATLRQKLVDALPVKQGQALAVSADTLRKVK
jgi:hypothetical protein